MGKGEVKAVGGALLDEFTEKAEGGEEDLGVGVVDGEGDELHDCHVGLFTIYSHIIPHMLQRLLLDTPGLVHNHLPIGLLNHLKVAL